MRFKRSDLPGLLIATLVPAGLFLLIVNAYDIWHHHGTPLMPTIAMHTAIIGGLVGAFSRFIKVWGLLGTIGALLLAALAGIFLIHQAGGAGTAADTALRISAAVLFLVANAVIVQQLIWNGIGPILDRRDQRKAAEREGNA